MTTSEALMNIHRLCGEGRFMEAEAACRKLLQAHPDLAEAEHLLGLIAHRSGNLDEAIEHLQRATTLAPRVAAYHANLGEMLRLAGHPRLAAEAARRALDIEPDVPAVLSNLGVALYESRDYEEAARAQCKAIAINPGFAEAHSNLGNALYGLRQFDEAIAAYHHAIELKPDYADAWANLGTALLHSGNFDEAVVASRRAIALAPTHANAHSGLGILLLMRGDPAEGWDEYAWRLRSTERRGRPFPELPWQGENLAGKHIYVEAEQGFGDTLQFVRYIPLLATRARKVTLRAHQQLVRLFRESLPDITVLGDRGDPEPFQYDAALLCLPRLFKTRLETIPANVPYLRAPADVTARWTRRLTKLAGLKVGLVWAGNPAHVNDTRRSIDVGSLTALLAVRGASFVSLQIGQRAAELRKLAGEKAAVEDLSSELEDFADTAAAINALDLVIAVDTSMAHLAGALGKPVWLLLPGVTDWRWLFSREDSPWYPSMRLFRQKNGEAWPIVIGRVVEELRAVVQGDEARLAPFRTEGSRRAAQAAAIIAAEATACATTRTQAPAMTPGYLLILAEQKRRLGLLSDADELARQSIAAEPENAEAMHALALIACQSGKLGEAIAHLQRAIAIDPNEALYHSNLGEMYRMAGRIDEAVNACRRALEINPGHASALSNLGVALFDQGKFEEALACYDRAVLLQENFAQAHSNRGNALQRLKRFAEAEACYRRASELRPAFADAWNNLGTCLRELRGSDEAEKAYRHALELDPHNPDILDNLALALKDLNRLDEAADLLRRALVIEQRSDKLHLHYGAILLDQKRIDDAEAALRRALAINPKNENTIRLMGRIALERVSG